jgi:hypothetical protein
MWSLQTQVRSLRRTLRRIRFAERVFEEVLLFLAANGEPSTYALFRSVTPYTMVNSFKLRNVWELARAADNRRLAGAFVECGVWRGGAAALMAYSAKIAKSERLTWLFDSFEGLPEPSARDGPDAANYAHARASGSLIPIGQCVATVEEVAEIFRKLGIDRTRTRIVAGWFQDTVTARAPTVGPIALLRLDVDWYESTRICLEGLYDSVVSGGYVVLDDYDFWKGSRAAVDEFFARRGIHPQLRRIPNGGRYLVKP